MGKCRHPRDRLGSLSQSLPTARHVLRLLISSHHRRDHTYMELVSNQLWQLEGFPFLPKRKVIPALDSFHSCDTTQPRRSTYCLSLLCSQRWYWISQPSVDRFPTLPVVSLQVRVFPGTNLRRKGFICAGVLELYVQSPLLTATGLQFGTVIWCEYGSFLIWKMRRNLLLPPLICNHSYIFLPVLYLFAVQSRKQGYF